MTRLELTVARRRFASETFFLSGHHLLIYPVKNPPRSMCFVEPLTKKDICAITPNATKRRGEGGTLLPQPHSKLDQQILPMNVRLGETCSSMSINIPKHVLRAAPYEYFLLVSRITILYQVLAKVSLSSRRERIFYCWRFHARATSSWRDQTSFR